MTPQISEGTLIKSVSQNSDELLDHRNQPHSLPRSGSMSQGLMDKPLVSRPLPDRRGSSDRRESVGDVMANYNNNSNEWAVDAAEDDLQFGLDDSQELPDVTLSKNASASQPRPRAGSHLDAVLSLPSRISPRLNFKLQNGPAPPPITLDFIEKDRRSRSRASSASSEEKVVLRPTPRNRKNSFKTMDKDERESIDACSRPDSENESVEAEQDVCFPMSDEVHAAEGVDFDELDEFVKDEAKEQQNRRPIALQRHSSTTLHKAISVVTEKEADLLRSSSEPLSSGSDSIGHNSRDYSSRFASPNIRAMNMSHMNVPRIAPMGPQLGKASSAPRSLTEAHLRQLAMNQDAPDRFSFFTSEIDETIHAPNIGGLLEGSGKGFQDLFRADRGVWWLDVMCPTDQEMKMLAKAFGIHPLTAEDIRVQETREKVELFKSYYFVCFRSFDPDKESEDYLEPINVYVVVFREGLLSFHFAPTSHPANVRRRIRQLRDYVSVSADWISYAIIDDITDVFMPLIREIECETDAIEDSVLISRSDDSGDMLRRIGNSRKKVMSLYRLLYGKADVIKMFAKRCNEQWDVAPKGEIGLYLGDIQDHIVTMSSSLVQFEKILSRAHSNYLAQLSIDSIQTNNRINAVLGKITFIATMLVPMNLLTGLFGMNVHVPWEGGNTLYPFFGIVAIIVFTTYMLGVRACCDYKKRNR